MRPPPRALRLCLSVLPSVCVCLSVALDSVEIYVLTQQRSSLPNGGGFFLLPTHQRRSTGRRLYRRRLLAGREGL